MFPLLQAFFQAELWLPDGFELIYLPVQACVCAKVGCGEKAHEAEEATLVLSEAPCPYLEA